MMEMVVFKNHGEIDPRLINTFGVNVKETENPIGFFGTGLKYAIAILLRHEQKISIFSGMDKYTFEARRETIRGKTFQSVYMNETRMGFTTDLGKTWELWEAYREVYCNTKDENSGTVFVSDSEPTACKGITYVIVEGVEFQQVQKNHYLYFVEDKPFAADDNVEVHYNANKYVYYRGVRIGELEHTAIFTYNMLRDIELTENRTAKSLWEISYNIGRFIMSSDNEDLIETCLLAQEGTFEFTVQYNHHIGTTGLKVLQRLIIERPNDVNPNACARFYKQTGIKHSPERLVLSPVQERMLEKGIAFSKSIGFPVTDYEIYPSINLGTTVMGSAANGKIYIAALAFDKGTKQVAATLIEEYIHLRFGLNDCTRGLQDHLFDKILSLGEDLTGEPL